MPSPLVHRIGGKTRLLRYLLAAMPRGFSTYVEAFAGGASLFWYLVPWLKAKGIKAVLSDIDPFIVHLYQIVQSERWVEFASRPWRYDDIKWREMHDQWLRDRVFPEEPRAIEDWIYRTAYVTHHSFIGLGNTPLTGERANRFENMRGRLGHYHQLLQDVEISLCDYRQTLWEHRGQGIFTYLDPPYVLTANRTRDFYRMPEPHRFMIEPVHPQEMASVCKQLGGQYLISYDDSPSVKDAFHDWQMVTIPVVYSVRAAQRGRLGMEKHSRVNDLLIANYPLCRQMELVV